jgi:NADH:ubiquinone oxidoreductase subunit 3 (subunit A)
MTIFFTEYLTLLIYFIFSTFVATLMIVLAKMVAPTRLESEKLSAYECGFEPFTSSRIRFDVTFSTIAILYLIFDLEIIFLIPWVVNSSRIGFIGYITVLYFLIILTIGFIIEWRSGALNWKKIDSNVS